MKIECIGVTKIYQEQAVLKNVSVGFEEGKVHGLIGRNGSGKTVLMKCICGYVRTDQGNVWIDQKELGKDIQFPDRMGLMLENPGFLPEFSGRYNLELLYTIRRSGKCNAVSDAMRKVGLEPDSRKKVGHYSLGMRQRLAIAQAIMEDPDLLILDEPFNGLDSGGVEEIRALLKEQRSEGKTILLSSHYAEDIEALCDTVHEMDAGVITRIR